VEFKGLLQGESLRAVLRQFDVSVLTSKNNEGLPNAVLESMAAGCPVVATAVGGTPEVIEDGVTGFLVPPEDPTALTERVLFLLKEPSLARSMSRRGRQKIEREFTVERMVGEFQRLYQDLLHQKRSQDP
jgi:glycosyltransferase involved in cell wall biosynthesis